MRRRERIVMFALLLLAPPVCLAQPPGRRAPQKDTVTVVQLPAPATEGAIDIDTALAGLSNMPAPSDQSLTLPEISQLAWAAQGRPPSATEPNAPTDERALLKVHFALPDGLYLYVPSDHSLRRTRNVDVRGALAASLLNRRSGPVGGGQIIVSGTSKDFAAQNGDNARDAMYLLAGKVVQSIQLEAAASNLTFIGINNVNAGAVAKACGFGKGIEPLYVLIVGYPAPVVQPTRNKKAIIVVPPEGFDDQEFFGTKRLLEMNSVEVTVASTRAGMIRSRTGATAVADKSLDPSSPLDSIGYNAIIFIGGADLSEFLNNGQMWVRVRLSNLSDLVSGHRYIVAASGNASAVVVAMLTEHGRGRPTLVGTRITGPIDIMPILTSKGATFTGRPVERDNRLITSVGAPAVPMFVQAILDAINGR